MIYCHARNEKLLFTEILNLFYNNDIDMIIAAFYLLPRTRLSSQPFSHDTFYNIRMLVLEDYDNWKLNFLNRSI